MNYIFDNYSGQVITEKNYCSMSSGTQYHNFLKVRMLKKNTITNVILDLSGKMLTPYFTVFFSKPKKYTNHLVYII